MKFKAYDFGDTDINFDLSVLKKAFNFLISRNDDISIFSHEKISDTVQHIVFHIPDEHISGTKKGGIDTKQPFSQFINGFIINKVMFLEVIKKNYLGIICNYLKDHYKLNTKECSYNNTLMKASLNYYQGRIKQIELSTSDGDIIEDGIELLDELNLDRLFKEYIVDFIAFQPSQSNNSFISLNKDGIIGLRLPNELDIYDLLIYMESLID